MADQQPGLVTGTAARIAASLEQERLQRWQSRRQGRPRDAGRDQESGSQTRFACHWKAILECLPCLRGAVAARWSRLVEFQKFAQEPANGQKSKG